MPKKVYIVYGWKASPEENWFPWLKAELEKRGFEVFVPRLPESLVPRIDAWINKLSDVVGVPDENTFFIGHSLGCQTIVRYLETLDDHIKIGGVVFVAGFFKDLKSWIKSFVNIAAKKLVAEWLEAPINLKKAKSHFDKSIAIFSTNDYFVSLENQDIFCDNFGSKIVIEHNKGHFSGSTGVFELPSALDAVLEISK